MRLPLKIEYRFIKILTWLYARYVNNIFIPEGEVSVLISNYALIYKKPADAISSVSFEVKPRRNVPQLGGQKKSHTFFSDFVEIKELRKILNP